MYSHGEGPERNQGETQEDREGQDATADAGAIARIAPSATPAWIDRYAILGTVGEGAMGIVYRAFDPDLDREVALKVLRDRRSQPPHGGARFLREAQSLARLKHPNVVTVYDVGFVGAQMFISMELVDGMPLSAWLAAAPRSWRETLAMAVGAGRGLAAAHAAGLIHRDVKPDNILIGNDGVSRIADFGLARMIGDGDRGAPASGSEPSEISVLSDPLTRTGSILGTPKYMAPEQAVGAAGAAVDARSDQFSFCVALYEALYGEHPFDASSQAALRDAIERGEVRPAPRGTAVPAWVRAPLLVGLRAQPARRHASMTTLLDALARDPAPRRRAIAASLGAAVIVTGAALALSRLPGEREAPCTGADRLLAGIWDPVRQIQLRAAFLATGSPLGAFTTVEVTRRLDRYGDELVAMHRDACEATQIRREQSPAVQDLRMRCLDQRLGELRALTGLFVQADAEIVRNAATAAGSLPSVAECGNTAALNQVQPEPTDPVIRTRIALLRPTLAQVSALTQAGKYAQAAPIAAQARADARAIRFRPLEAEAAFLSGNVEAFRGHFAESSAAFEAALWSAEAAHADVLAARSATMLVSVTNAGGHPDEAHRWERHALATVERAGDELVRATFEIKVGRMSQDEGHQDDAVAHAQRAYAIRARLLGPDEPRTAEAITAIGDARSFQFKDAEANDSYRRAMAIYVKQLGPDHPQVAAMWSRMGLVAWDRGRFQEAFDDHQRALEIRERVLEPDNPQIATTCNNLGIAADDLHRYEDALRYYRRALAIRSKTLEPDHPTILASRNNIGGLYVSLERWQAARDELTEVLRLKEHKLGPDHADVAGTLINLGHVELHEGRIAVAEAETLRAQAILAQQSDPDRRAGGAVRAQLAEIRARQGRRDEARALARRAIAELTIAGERDLPDLTEPLELLAKLSPPADAVPLLKRAVAIHDRTDLPSSTRASQARSALAKAQLAAR